jgi:nucleotide-binding universal stress UspA family protein
MFKRILVAVDGSHTAMVALQEAIKLGKELQAQLRVVHVVDMVTVDWPAAGDFEDVTEVLHKASAQVFEKAEEELCKAGMSAEMKLLEIETMGHRIAEMVVNEAAAWPADLIVIGSHGRRGVSRLLLGSVAEGVARISSTPVLIISGK